MKRPPLLIISIIFAVIAFAIVGYVVWYQGAQEDALDYSNVQLNTSQ